jgi:uncharacterized protein YggU (UPF0235/DUF167 family)
LSTFSSSVFNDTPDGATLIVRVTPRAGRTSLAGVAGGHLLVRIAAAPVDDAANEALKELLARVLDVPRRSIEISAGRRGRTKRVTIAGHRAAILSERLAAAMK